MADPVVADVEVNLTTNAENVTTRIPATPEGIAVAYGSLVIMALLPIFYGSFRSVRYHKEQQVLLHTLYFKNYCVPSGKMPID